MENFIVVIEKRETIGTIQGQDIITWNLFDVMKLNQLKEWCQDRGYEYPSFPKANLQFEQKVDFANNMCASLWDVSPRA